jgi:hypothetical protein
MPIPMSLVVTIPHQPLSDGMQMETLQWLLALGIIERKKKPKINPFLKYQTANLDCWSEKVGI